MSQISRITPQPKAAVAVGAALATALSFSPAIADEALADLVERVSPAVVTVLATEDAKEQRRGPHFGRPDGGAFEEFFKRFGDPRGLPDDFPHQRPRQGLGSGFILDEDGWIVTNHHVVDGADDITVRLSDRRTFDVEVIGVDKATDIALLRIDAEEDLPFVKLGDSDSIRVGDDVAAVGNPFGLGGTVTQGIVSAKGRDISSGPYADFIQTDAAINRGNSGGPLFNMKGEVIGVNSAIYSPTGGSVGVGFAVASNIVERVVADLKDDGQVDRGWLGVSIQDVTPSIAEALDLDPPRGALVASVVEGSPSDGKLEAGDVILKFDGAEVSASRDLPKLVAAARAGEAAAVEILRDGKTKDMEVTIGALPNQQHASLSHGAPDHETASEMLGATLEKLTPEARDELGLAEGAQGAVVTSLNTSGRAAKAGLLVGDVILRVDDQDVMDPAALDSVLENHDRATALMLVHRNGGQIFVAVKTA